MKVLNCRGGAGRLHVYGGVHGGIKVPGRVLKFLKIYSMTPTIDFQDCPDDIGQNPYVGG